MLALLILSFLKRKLLLTTSFILFVTVLWNTSTRKKNLYVYLHGLLQTANLDIRLLFQGKACQNPKQDAYSNTLFFSYVRQIYILVLHLNLLLCIFFFLDIFSDFECWWWNFPRCTSDSQKRFLLYHRNLNYF